MKRDMDLCRKILFTIEESEKMVIYNIDIEGYSLEQISYHCKLLNEAMLISDYNAQYSNNSIYAFAVGQLTWEGHDYLDKIRNDTIWVKTKEIITKQGLPMLIDVIKPVAQSIITSMTEGAIKAILE